MAASATIDALLEDVFAQAKALIRQRYGDFRRLAATPEMSPGPFFDGALHAISDIYAATAGAIWIRGDANTVRCVAQRGTEKLGLTGEYQQPHSDLLAYALSQPGPFVVSPNSRPRPGAGASNPTDSFLVFGPVVHNGVPVGLIELFLGPRPVRGKTPEVRRGYVRFMEVLTPLVLDFLLRKAQERTEAAPATAAPAKPLSPAEVTQRLQLAERQVAAQREVIRRTLERVVQDLTGFRPVSLAEGRAMTARIHQLLEANGFRVACPQCSSPAILRCQSTRGSALFVFDHTLPTGRTFHGGVPELPWLRVVAKSMRGVRITLHAKADGEDGPPVKPA